MNHLEQEETDAKAFDEVAHELLALPLEDLRLKECDWQKFDDPCPPSNAYVHAIQRLGDLEGKKILDYGCGDGYLSAILAKRGALVWAFDTSSQSIEVASRRVVVNGLERTIHCSKMSAYNLEYEDEMFDRIVGLDILHHIDIGMATGEITRVLRRGGKAVFQEPFANSRVLQTVRRITPVRVEKHAASQERQLTYRDVEQLGQAFTHWTIKEFQLLSRLDRVVGSRRIHRWLHLWDQRLLDAFPPLRPYARLIVIELFK